MVNDTFTRPYFHFLQWVVFPFSPNKNLSTACISQQIRTIIGCFLLRLPTHHQFPTKFSTKPPSILGTDRTTVANISDVEVLLEKKTLKVAPEKPVFQVGAHNSICRGW